MKIETTAIRKNGEIRGHKVYLDGRKYPRKPAEYYTLPEAQAIKKAIEDHRRDSG